MAAFNLTLEWWQVIGFSIFWWLSMIGAYRYGWVNRRHSDRNRSRNRSHSHPTLFDDASFTDLAALTPELPPPPPQHEPELTPWIAYDGGVWQRVCPARCHNGLLYNPVRHCSMCDGSGYQITYTNPHVEMLPSPSTEVALYEPLHVPATTDDEAGQAGQIMPWPPSP